MNKLVLVPTEKIVPDPNQPRTIFDEEHIKRLAESFKSEGIINPIEVDPSYMIITGECRWKAAKLAGLKEVPVNVNDRDFDSYTRLRRQVIENIHQGAGAAMNPIDTAKGYLRLIMMKYNLRKGKILTTIPQAGDYFSLRQQEKLGLISGVAKEVGQSHTSVLNSITLLEEPKWVLEDILRGRPKEYYVAATAISSKEHVEAIKQKIAAGDYKSSDDVWDDAMLVKKFPELTEKVLERRRSQEDARTNRVLTNIARIALSLEAVPSATIAPDDRQLVLEQLQWLQEKIERYIKI